MNPQPFEPNPFVFWILAALTVGCALAVVRARKLFHAGLNLVGSFFGVAGLYVLLEAPFLAGVQVLVYIGAIAVVLLFAIMLTHHMMNPEVGTLTTQPWVALVLCLFLLAVLLGVTQNTAWTVHPDQTMESAEPAPGATAPLPRYDTREAIPSVKALGVRFLDPWVLPFELISVVILVAMIGAVVIARKEEGRPPQDVALREEVAP